MRWFFPDDQAETGWGVLPDEVLSPAPGYEAAIVDPDRQGAETHHSRTSAGPVPYHLTPAAQDSSSLA